MNKRKASILAFSRFPVQIFCFLSLFLLSASAFIPQSFAQSCSIMTMKSGDRIRACQIEDMRKLINEARAACSLGAIAPYPFSDSPLVPGRTPISVRHIRELEQAMDDIAYCGDAHPATINYKTIKDNDIIATTDFSMLYNEFIAVPFCGDSICQAGREDLTTCPVDCGGQAQFYCNGIMGGCYAAVNCPAGKTCYSALGDCRSHADADCGTCVPNCVGQETRKTCDSWPDGCGGLCWGTMDVTCDCAANMCAGSSCTDSCGNVCPGTKAPDLSCASSTCVGDTCSDGCGGVVIGTATSTCDCAGDTCAGSTCVDKCGVTCPGTKPSCACAASTCVGQSCSDDCDGATCAGTKLPDCSQAVNYCWDDGLDDGCGTFCPGTKPCTLGITQDCSATPGVNLYAIGSNPNLDGYVYYRCDGNCTPTDADQITGLIGNGVQWKDTTAVMGQTYTYAAKFHDSARNTYSQMNGFTAFTFTGQPDCSCASDTYFDDGCSDGCGGFCSGTHVDNAPVHQECGSPAISYSAVTGDFPTLQGYYLYRCSGDCVPKDSDKISPLIGNGMPWTDTNVTVGQTYTYSFKPSFSDRDPGIFSNPTTITVEASSGDCSCAADTCVGSSCSDGCGGTCAGTKAPDCSCASNTCTGSTCSDGCGGTCPGTKTCDFPPIECKKWSCPATDNGFCQQDHSETCSCPTGLKPTCYSTTPITCGTVSCPDTICKCIQ